MPAPPGKRDLYRRNAYLRKRDNFRAEDRGYSSPCWTWLGEIHKRYPVIRCEGTIFVHRANYEEMVGPIPEGLTLDHLCCNPDCVNPHHCEPVTRAENTRRGNEKRGFGLGVSAYDPSYWRVYSAHRAATDPGYLERRRAKKRIADRRRRALQREQRAC